MEEIQNDQSRTLCEYPQQKSDHCGFWHGNPNPASQEYLFGSLNVKDDFEFGLKLGSTCRWIMPDEHHVWRRPDGRALFRPAWAGRSAIP